MNPVKCNIHLCDFFVDLFSPEFEWNFHQDLSAILVKQEEPDGGPRLDPQSLEGPSLVLSPAPPRKALPWRHTVSVRERTL